MKNMSGGDYPDLKGRLLISEAPMSSGVSIDETVHLAPIRDTLYGV